METHGTAVLDRPPTSEPVIAVPRPPVPPARGAGLADRLHLRRPSRSGWITAAIGALALMFNTWGLASAGYANSYYTAAVRSASVSWKAWFFGAIDPGSFITVDKPPFATQVMGLSARIFGFSTWSMLIPEALAGVASVLILHYLVRRWAGDTAAHLAALALATTPVAVEIFRYNNPDAILTLLCVGAAWALWSAIETGRTRALVVSAVLLGFAFNTKMLQAFLVLPAFGLVYLFAGKPKLGKRLWQLAVMAVTLIAASSWWVAIVALWPASARPYIGSTSDNSIVSLVLGYNGLSRLFGASAAGGGGNTSTGFGGNSGLFRLFNTANGAQISWLIPVAVIALAVGLWQTRRRPRTDQMRAGWLLWGGWAAVCFVIFSFSSGVFHQYYPVQMAPAVAALAGAGGVTLWRAGRTNRWLRWVLPATVIAGAAWAYVLLSRIPGYMPWLRPAIVVGAVLAAMGLWLGGRLRHRLLVLAAGTLAALTLLAGPTAYAITTIAHPQSGSIIAAGPTASSTGIGGFGGGGGGGGVGGGSTSADTALVAYLEAHQGSAKYLVAAFGSQSSAPIIIASGKAVITIGGFNGGDPAPTLSQFKALVASGQVKYVLVSSGGQGGGPGGAGGSSSISSWVTSHGKAVTVAGSSSGTLYLVTSTS